MPVHKIITKFSASLANYAEYLTKKKAEVMKNHSMPQPVRNIVDSVVYTAIEASVWVKPSLAAKYGVQFLLMTLLLLIQGNYKCFELALLPGSRPSFYIIIRSEHTYSITFTSCISYNHSKLYYFSELEEVMLMNSRKAFA